MKKRKRRILRPKIKKVIKDLTPIIKEIFKELKPLIKAAAKAYIEQELRKLEKKR